jgi:Flp pilus assembly protein TadB
LPYRFRRLLHYLQSAVRFLRACIVQPKLDGAMRTGKIFGYKLLLYRHRNKYATRGALEARWLLLVAVVAVVVVVVVVVHCFLFFVFFFIIAFGLPC